MKASILITFLLLSVAAVAAEIPADKDQANRAKFESACAAMITAGGPCAEVKKGGGGRRGCVAEPQNLDKATAECKAAIQEWKALKQQYK